MLILGRVYVSTLLIGCHPQLLFKAEYGAVFVVLGWFQSILWHGIH